VDSRKKIVTLKTLLGKLTNHRRAGKKIAFTNGCFDIIHYGHTAYLEKAKTKDRILVVGLNSDRSVRALKGKARPICPQRQRAGVLAALACVDYVTIFDADTPDKLIRAVCPDILIKGADWKGKKVVGGDWVKKNKGRVQFIRFVPGCSTTRLIDDIKRRA